MANKLARTERDRAIGRIAARQHGVVTITQLRVIGLPRSGVSDRVAAGRLHRMHRGVYAVGHPNLSQDGRWHAAVLACGEGAVLSHRSAAALWKIRRLPVAETSPADSPVDVTVPGDGGRAKRRGIRIHRSPTLQPRDCTLRNGVPVTNPARTLHDLRRVVSEKEFATAVREAEYLRLAIGDQFGPDATRSELESRLLGLCRRHRLPQPRVNERVDRYVVDFLWGERRLIVEVDGWESHRFRTAFEEDRARDARLKLLGYEVLRFTWRQVTSDAPDVAQTIRALLRR